MAALSKASQDGEHDELDARVEELEEAGEEAADAAGEHADDEGEADPDGLELLADEGRDEEGGEAVGADDEAVHRRPEPGLLRYPVGSLLGDVVRSHGKTYFKLETEQKKSK